MKKNKTLAKGLNCIGILLMITVILTVVPLTIPKLFGVRIYGVLTGSMTPTYPIGGVVYVTDTSPDEIRIGDVITYQMGSGTDYVLTHRVMEIEDKCFITKGDANNEKDPEPVLKERLIGKVRYYIPGLAKISDFMNSTIGCCVYIMLFCTALMLFVVADLISPKEASNRTEPQKKIVSQKRKSLSMQLTGGVLILGGLLYLGNIYLGYQKAAKEYDALEQEVFGENKEEKELPEISVEGKEIQFSEEEQQVLAGLRRLHEENSEVIGWIQFDHMEISYPIMQGEDNEYYLKHTYSGEESSSGSIFMETANNSDFEDCHTILYGHNMKDLSMFGSLKQYKTEEHYKGNEYFTIYTLDTVYRYQIFAYYDVAINDEIYDIQFQPDETFKSFIQQMLRNSYEDTGIKPEKTDKIITLSTCSTKGKRFVVSGVRL